MLSESDWLSSSAGLPSGFCAICDRQVLLSQEEGDLWACVHCEAAVASAELVAEEEIGEVGYSVVEEPAAGCGTGCGAGGCGPGRLQTTAS